MGWLSDYAHNFVDRWGDDTMDEQYIELSKNWRLRKLSLGDRSEWALQYHGMDWLRITEFLQSGNSTIDEEIRKFADEIKEEKKDAVPKMR